MQACRGVDSCSYETKDSVLRQSHDGILSALNTGDEGCQQRVLNHKGPSTSHDCALLHHLLYNCRWNRIEVSLQLTNTLLFEQHLGLAQSSDSSTDCWSVNLCSHPGTVYSLESLPRLQVSTLGTANCPGWVLRIAVYELRSLCGNDIVRPQAQPVVLTIATRHSMSVLHQHD